MPLSEMEEGKNANTNIFRKITTFIRPLKLWIRDFTSARAKEKETETRAVIAPPVIKHHYTEAQNKIFADFSLRFEEISARFEKRLSEIDDPVEEQNPQEKENPFLNFKLDHSSLRDAFLLKL